MLPSIVRRLSHFALILGLLLPYILQHGELFLAFFITINFLFQPPPSFQQSKSSKSKISETDIAQFCGITGATYVLAAHFAVLPRDPAQPLISSYSVRDAKKYLDKHKRIENAIDAFYNEGGESSSLRATPSSADPAKINQRLNQMYDTYKGMFFPSPSPNSSHFTR